MKRCILVILSILLGGAASLVCSERSAPSSIPRSTQRKISFSDFRHPPWNPSPNIDKNGFLLKQYDRVPGEWEKEIKPIWRRRRDVTTDIETPTIIRQVPGDGNCLFHAISTCHAYATNGTHVDLESTESLKWLYKNSARLREQAVDCLEDGQGDTLLFLQGQEYLRASDLVEAAASQYDLSGEDYCKQMRQDSYWGGGPEIVALCNVLQRPIHIYELAAREGCFVLRRMACFGSPKFDRRSALHILSADSRFPDLKPGQQLASGNHFLAMFPVCKAHRRRGVRGGDDHSQEEVVNPFRSWWRRFLRPEREDSRSKS